MQFNFKMIYDWIHESEQDKVCNKIFSRKRLRNQAAF